MNTASWMGSAWSGRLPVAFSGRNAVLLKFRVLQASFI